MCPSDGEGTDVDDRSAGVRIVRVFIEHSVGDHCEEERGEADTESLRTSEERLVDADAHRQPDVVVEETLGDVLAHQS